MTESNLAAVHSSKLKGGESGLPFRVRGCRSRSLSLFFCLLFGIGSGIFYSEPSIPVASLDEGSGVSDGHARATHSSLNGAVGPAIPRSHFKSEREWLAERPQLIVVTPTYVRAFQAMYLTKMVNLLRQIPPPTLWIVVELEKQTVETACLLRNSGLMYRHLVNKTNMTHIKDRGVHQRNLALEYIEQHKLNGIVYFADDDNAYSLELFEEIRRVKRFGVFPVGMLQQAKSKVILEGPVCESGRVIGWHTNEKSKRVRRFHVDMSGFAFNSTVLWDSETWPRPTTDPIRQLDTVKEGFQETTFIAQLVPDEYSMEALANDCSRVMVWHLHAEAPGRVRYPRCTENLGFSLSVPVKTLS